MDAWQDIEKAEEQFLNTLADLGGLAPEASGMLRHCARLIKQMKVREQPPKPAVPMPLIPLSKEDAAAVLRQFNRWRLGDDALEQPDSTIALALIIAIEALAEAAGRADAVPAWFGELPAPISNPEAWPANYAGGYNDALNMCYDVIRGHAPQQMTTQGEAVATVCLIGERYAHGTMIEVQLQIVPGTELPIGTKLYTGSQP